MIKNTTHTEKTWDLKTKIESRDFDNYDFTKTNFNSAIFNNVNFSHCVFEQSNLANSKIFYDSNFEYCLFENLDLSHTTVGSHKGTYQDCIFKKCNFKRKEFNFTRFINCKFESCALTKINFNASSFKNCQFIGKLSDVNFNGIYDTNQSEFKTLENVDFSESTLGDFVTFHHCDLSTCTAPKGFKFSELLYSLYETDANIMSTGSKDRIILR